MRPLPLIAALALSTASAQFAAPASTPVNPSADRALLERVVTSMWDATPDSVVIRTGQLPPAFPLSLPAGSRVIGSVVTVRPGVSALPSTAVYWETSLTPQAAQQALVGALERGGWRLLPLPFGPGSLVGGFQPSDRATAGVWYRRSPDQTALFRVRQVGGVTQGSLTLSGAENLDGQLRAAGVIAARPGDGLPVLRPPVGAEVHVDGQGSTGDDLDQSARVVTDLSPAALLAHYASQLKGAGWRLVNEAQVGGVQTSLWVFTQGARQNLGVFTVQAVGKGEYRARLSTVMGR